MQTEQPVPEGMAKRPGRREHIAINFDLREFKKDHPEVSRGIVAKKLGISEVSLDNYRGRAPISVYKAIIQAFAPQDAHKYELRLLVERTLRPFYITEQCEQLSREYDRANAGSKITFADGKGYYQIAPQQAEALPPAPYAEDSASMVHDREVPLPSEGAPQLSVSEADGIIAEIRPAVNDETLVLLQQQEALIAMLARVARERDDKVLEANRLQRLLADRDATVTQLATENKQLKQSIREWEELSKQEGPKGVPITEGSILLLEDVLKRLGKTLQASGHPQLAQELDRISPKKTGYHSLPQHAGLNGNSKHSR